MTPSWHNVTVAISDTSTCDGMVYKNPAASGKGNRQQTCHNLVLLWFPWALCS